MAATYKEKIEEIFTPVSNFVALTFATTDFSKTAESVYGLSLTTIDGNTNSLYFGSPTRSAIEFENVNPICIAENKTLDDVADFLKEIVYARVPGNPVFISSGSRTWAWSLVKALKAASESWASIPGMFMDLRDVYAAIYSNYRLTLEDRPTWELFPEAKALSQKFGLNKIADAVGVNLFQTGERSAWTSALTVKVFNELINRDYPVEE